MVSLKERDNSGNLELVMPLIATVLVNSLKAISIPKASSPAAPPTQHISQPEHYHPAAHQSYPR
jgi:hypothetical protein